MPNYITKPNYCPEFKKVVAIVLHFWTSS